MTFEEYQRIVAASFFRRAKQGGQTLEWKPAKLLEYATVYRQTIGQMRMENQEDALTLEQEAELEVILGDILQCVAILSCDLETLAAQSAQRMRKG